MIKINEDGQSYNNPVNISHWHKLIEKNTDDAWKNIESEDYKNYNFDDEIK